MTENGSKEVVTHTPAGKWAVGNPGGPGRPSKEIETRFSVLLKETVTEDDWVEIILKAVKQAKLGQWRAREWLASYIIGKPTQIIDASLTDNRDVLIRVVNE